MFTGIIEHTGIIEDISGAGTNRTYRVRAPYTGELQVDQSVSHNGICLTVESITGDEYTVTAIAETINKTTIAEWKNGTRINLERCVRIGGRLDGHMVQGHVDTVGTCISREEKDGSWEFSIRTDVKFAALMIEKGSIALNGISLTIFNVLRDSFSVAVIPYTFEHTNMNGLQPGDRVNLEFDMIGKYVNRMNEVGV